MATADLFIDTRPQLGLLTLDCSISESHQIAHDWTENPVERGAASTDHARRRPRTITIEGIVSRLLDPLRIRDPSFDLSPRRHMIAWQKLKAMANAQQPILVSTSLERYPRMVIDTVDVVRDVDNTEALRFTVTLHEYIVANTTFVAALADDVEDLAGPAANQGTQATQTATEPVTAAAVGAA